MPTVTGAAATGFKSVTVTFSGAVDASALDPDAYAFAGQTDGTVPFVTPVAVAVTANGSAAVDIVTDIEFSRGVLYLVTVTGVTGVVGPTNQALFTAVTPGAPADRAMDLMDFIPAVNVREDTTGQLAKFIACLQELFDLLAYKVDAWTTIFDPDLATEQFLDLILLDLGNPFNKFISGLSETDKRRLVRVLVALYKLKGTAVGLQDAIRFFLGFESQIIGIRTFGMQLGVSQLNNDFILGGGTFWDLAIMIATTSTSGRALTVEELDRVLQLVDLLKPAEEHTRLVTTGLLGTNRLEITPGGGANDLVLSWGAVTDATAYNVYRRATPRVSPYNAAVTTSVGVATASLTLAPPMYFVIAGKNGSIPGFFSNEVTNALAEPVLSATAGPHSIELTWPAVTGASAYYIYKKSVSFPSPRLADNAADPIKVYADQTSYVDQVRSGTTAYYIITPVRFGSEGFYSNQVSATAL